MGKKICLLRGINVGGKNIIKMSDLKSCFEKMGFEDVETYIQSGNVIFSSKEANSALTKLIERELLKKFSYKEPILLLSDKKLKTIVSSSPKDFGNDPDKYRYDVIYIIKGITTKTFAKTIALKEGVDHMSVGKDVLYFSRLKSEASKSYLSKIISRPEYKLITIRNWNTTIKLNQKLET
ncbi:MAG: hypothetical protein COW00_12675 [Bdellovibrio sp. CG12_big_fil_rev_8_21_14_0_65_39_13]|nr:MAG: hypothetical protein COW00_12675 [Bdellovibrio sp. CG12_big_fil_rev_8_21_14_0_65_39_13]PIR33014.1 MAG: hypothetical protein COV37_18135 [Bdellovibrio sp. CG11_big_fil_rev_8_21_14_0_20_39_38]